MDSEKIIESVDTKTRKLGKMYSEQKDLLQSKDMQIKELQDQVAGLSAELRKLKDKENINQINNIINSRSDISESKAVISDLLRKVNRAIAILQAAEDKEK